QGKRGLPHACPDPGRGNPETHEPLPTARSNIARSGLPVVFLASMWMVLKVILVKFSDSDSIGLSWPSPPWPATMKELTTQCSSSSCRYGSNLSLSDLQNSIFTFLPSPHNDARNRFVEAQSVCLVTTISLTWGAAASRLTPRPVGLLK